MSATNHGRLARFGLAFALLALLIPSTGPQASDPHSSAGLQWPVPGFVLNGFTAQSQYGPGHRGLDIAAQPGAPVIAPASGTITWAGSINDNLAVTIESGELLVTVSALASSTVIVGDPIVAGRSLGRAGCSPHAPSGGVHLSVRHKGQYVNPAPLLARRATELIPPDQTLPDRRCR